MEQELTCKFCKCFFSKPILLPCGHGICYKCAQELQRVYDFDNFTAIPTPHSQSSNSSSSAHSNSSASSDHDDKISVFSESDSGLGIGSGNLPKKYCLKCPECFKIIALDDSGIQGLPVFKIMESIITRFKQYSRCQMCEVEPKIASVVCEQCDIRYCDHCREVFHPNRGPLANHNFIKPLGHLSTKDSVCEDHGGVLSIFCTTCKLPACETCLAENRHDGHNFGLIGKMCKIQKTELSHNLHQLSANAVCTTDLIVKLKNANESILQSFSELENSVNSKCEMLIQMIYRRQDDLLEAVRLEKETKLRFLKDQQTLCTSKLQQTTGFLQFCIESLKETDSAAFMQVSDMLITKVKKTDTKWQDEISEQLSFNDQLSLFEGEVCKAIEDLNFIKLKPPLAPMILPEDCSVDNNSVTIRWSQPELATSFTLELRDEHSNEYKEVYSGGESICTMEGLHFNTLYNARVRAANSSGYSGYSKEIQLKTAKVAWFSFDTKMSAVPGSGIIFSNNNMTVSVDGWEHRVALGTVGFSRGVHYWEFCVEKYVVNTDLVFGIARVDVMRDRMLGKDDKSYVMYIDCERSWFQHNSVHERRIEGGIQEGSTVGVLLDLDRRSLRFLVNNMPQGSVAFNNLTGVFYPAVSVNRGVSLTLNSGIEPPELDY